MCNVITLHFIKGGAFWLSRRSGFGVNRLGRRNPSSDYRPAIMCRTEANKCDRQGDFIQRRLRSLSGNPQFVGVVPRSAEMVAPFRGARSPRPTVRGELTGPRAWQRQIRAQRPSIAMRRGSIPSRFLSRAPTRPGIARRIYPAGSPWNVSSLMADTIIPMISIATGARSPPCRSFTTNRWTRGTLTASSAS